MEPTPHDELADRVKTASDAVPNGSRWRHDKTGVVYTVLGVALDEATHNPVVMYCDVDHPRPFAWSRPLREFTNGRFTRAGDAAVVPGSVRVEESSP